MSPGYLLYTSSRDMYFLFPLKQCVHKQLVNKMVTMVGGCRGGVWVWRGGLGELNSNLK